MDIEDGYLFSKPMYKPRKLLQKKSKESLDKRIFKKYVISSTEFWSSLNGVTVGKYMSTYADCTCYNSLSHSQSILLAHDWLLLTLFHNRCR